MESRDAYRELDRQWNYWMIIAAAAMSFLGTFTSTQLMIQARMSLQITTVFTWVLLASLIFGFCSVWSLHFVAMLACELDLPIGLDIGLTLLSAGLAVIFTFVALAPDILMETYSRARKPKRRSKKPPKSFSAIEDEGDDALPLLGQEAANASSPPQDQERRSSADDDDEAVLQRVMPQAALVRTPSDMEEANSTVRHFDFSNGHAQKGHAHKCAVANLDIDDNEQAIAQSPERGKVNTEVEAYEDDVLDRTETASDSRGSASRRDSTSSYGIHGLMNIAYRGTVPAGNAFVRTYELTYASLNRKHIVRGLVWSLAIWSMHYCGLFAMIIPGGYMRLDTPYVVAAEMIAWIVCIFGSILMTQIEPHLSQQLLFSLVVTLGIAAMHFTGMRSARLYSREQPSKTQGYPAQLPIAIVAVAITTCMMANGLLAHAATMSRNKLAEIVWTRRKLWRAMAQKENAEAAAAARSDFIASASHEIRTPLHHLQGYSDLLSRTDLNDEGRMLLQSIQRAVKTLSLITNNVLDWSKLESDTDAVCRPVALNMRSVCESILVLLPNKEEDTDVEVMVVVSPQVPSSLYIDETYIHRILMNLLSNALKFTRQGYVMLSLEMEGKTLIAKVRDSGFGVPPSFLPQLFEPFTQAQTRGSQRGTGLGLSIVRKLLHKMEGSVEVESRHPENDDVEPDQTGTTFSIRLPMQVSMDLLDSDPAAAIQTVALFHEGRPRALEGLETAWELYGFNVVVVTNVSELSNLQFKYVWADAKFLENHPVCLQGLLLHKEWTVLVPYNDQNAVRRLAGLLSAPHFIPMQRPLKWHTFEHQIAIAKQAPTKSGFSKAVRFASHVEVASPKVSCSDELALKNVNILLVEDNPINQKLGNKMLSSLGYQVLLAEDGDEAVEKVLQHDTIIDMILMDQSMPIKDGVTATREIRALEAEGKLSRRHPIIAVTAVVDTESRALFQKAGADEFLAKPLSLGKLEQTLATFLRVE